MAGQARYTAVLPESGAKWPDVRLGTKLQNVLNTAAESLWPSAAGAGGRFIVEPDRG